MSESETSPSKTGVGGDGGALNSLRNFRLQKKKFTPGGFDTDSSQEPSQNQEDPSLGAASLNQSLEMESPIRQAGYKKRVLDDRTTPEPSHSQNGENGFSDPRPPAHKRIRMISDSESENGSSPTKVDLNLPLPDEIEKKVNFLKNACPSVDPMILQDTLKAHDWNVDWAIESLAPKEKSKPKSSSKADKGMYINKRLKSHQVDEDNSESDDDEFTGKGLVFDSDEEEEGPSDDNMTADKKKVLKFFNEGGEQEMTGIQGCNKKKVGEVIKLRPFAGWVDLVTKLQQSRGLSTEMLNNATELLRMKSAVTKLMNKCQKITAKMEGIVEQLTSCSQSMLELSEQPKSLNPAFKLSFYQIIGLNWLVLMHKQSLNGILADEMGLGKTIQTIAFLAHLKEMGEEGPHLIVVPSSTLENWRKELELWAPDIKIVTYWGAQDERRHLRLQLVQDELDYDVILTTYNMVVSSPEDRVLFKKMEFCYVVFDEAHMLKNMASQRYEQLMKIRCSRKLLLTGTPLQNNLVELMSLLIFVMPGMFAKRKDQLKRMFSLFPKSQDDTERTHYEKDRIAHAKRIMKPFFLRRLKVDVLTDLPNKVASVERVPMSQRQSELYYQLVTDYKDRAAKIEATGEAADSGMGMLMNLRKTANHPLLVRDQYDDHKLGVMARLLKTRDSGHSEANETFIVEDLKVMSDFEINRTCETYRCLEHLTLSNNLMCDSGKFQLLDDLLPDMKNSGDRVLIFSQFTMLLDVLERYLKIRGYKYMRLDGQTPVQDRQQMIDKFNKEEEIFIFILSTRAGGLGINLTAANTVILHDLDFNPYNDKQAEDRCHRVGQTKEVKVIRFTSEDTIEEGIHNIAMEKLKLEQDVTGEADTDPKTKKKDVARLLKLALGVELKEKQIGDVGKVYTEL
eukprot:TRINITY_DN5767_c0_g1_i1.p1 TRINITY_DN5767_c0_g1~~TRINITY_DN5767_c0_g1_i1.p1  ORF type:complete len:906 (-),score=328.78 TRINITY_DN5767_c0_g1_i1:158-2875(-)